MTSILAVDPGGTTGLAWCDALWSQTTLDDRFGATVGVGQITGDIGEQIWKIAQGIKRLDVRLVVAESSDHFLLRSGGALRKTSLIPIRLSGGLMAAVTALNHQGVGVRYEVRYEEQTPSQAKGTISDDVLHALGFTWLKTKERHQADAMRHLVLALRRIKQGRLELT